ncbi:hypothetical protein [Acinetobacter sp.]|uniref:hypothetical protein n=1 Tax=Acinetobacter sp. TaxID=472 RepID=UPI003D02E2AC
MNNNTDFDDEFEDQIEEKTQKELKLIRRNIGNQSIRKGIVRDNIPLVAWDCIQDCVPDRCHIGQSCEYAHISHSNKGTGGKCALQTEYIQSFISTVLKTYKYLDESDMFKVGMHLVPLYSQLCRQKIVEKAVGDIMQLDHRGNMKVHPIYREIRDTIRVISGLWRDMGITSCMNPSLPSSTPKEGFGDPTHYAKLIAGAENKRNVVR